MPDYRLVAPRRRVVEHTIVRGVREAIMIPVGMQGVGQFRERAAGYMQVEPAYERPVAGLGDIRQAIVGLIAGKELDQLMSAVRRLNDEIVHGIEFRNKIVKSYKDARALLDDAIRRFGPATIPAGMVTIPNPLVLPAYKAITAARKGVQVLARQVQTLGMMERVFMSVSYELTRAGASNDANAVDGTLAQVRRFVRDTDDMLFAIAPEYMVTKRAILVRAEQEFRTVGIAVNDVGNPRWLALYVQAANAVVPIPQPAAPAEVAAAGLGNPIPLVAAVILWVVGIVAAAVVASRAISEVIDAFNSEAITARKLILQRESDWTKIERDMRAAGKSEADIAAARKAWETGTKKAVEGIPKSEFGAGILIPLGIVAGFAVGKAAGVF